MIRRKQRRELGWMDVYEPVLELGDDADDFDRVDAVGSSCPVS